MTRTENHKRTGVWYAIILVAAVYLISLGLLEKRGFWNVDNANKFLQLQAIVDSNYEDYSIPWPGSDIDSDFRYSPLPHPFSVVKDGRLFSIYSPVFAMVSSVFFKSFGFWGLYLLPLIFSLLLLFGVLKILNTLECGLQCRNWAILVAGLCTPIWFYSVLFWEHIIAVCFCVWGISFCLQFLKTGFGKHLVFGAAISAVGVYFRDELYLFCGVLFIAVLLGDPRGRLRTLALFALGMIFASTPLWLIQWLTIGHPLGFHIGSHLFSAASIAEHIADRPQVFYNLFVTSSTSTWFSLILTLPFMIAFLINPSLSEGTLKAAVPAYCLVALASSVFVLGPYLFSDAPIAHLLRSNSLFAASPILILAFMRHRNPGTLQTISSLRRWLWLVALVYAVVYGLTAPKLGSWGIHWGNRFLLILYPLLAILCAVNLAEWWGGLNRKVNWRAAVVVLTILVSFGAQVYSQTILGRKKAFSYRLNREIRDQSGEVIVTNVWWVPQELYTEFYTRPIFLVRSVEAYHQLRGQLAARGYKNLLWITPASGKKLPPGTVEISDGGLNFFNLQFQSVYIDHP